MDEGGEEREIFAELLRKVGENYTKKELLTGFVGLKGVSYKGERVVVGRAVNGWTEKGWYPEQLREPDARLEITRAAFEASQGRDGRCPMSWVTCAWNKLLPIRWNIRRAKFWTVTRCLVGQLGIAEVGESDNWPSHIAWTNLYKVSPFCGGNPLTRLAYIREDLSAKLLIKERSQWNPARVLMMTDLNCAQPFLNLLNDTRMGAGVRVDLKETPQKRFVDAEGTLRLAGSDAPARVIVAKYPQVYPRAPFVEEVLRSFQEAANPGA